MEKLTTAVSKRAIIPIILLLLSAWLGIFGCAGMGGMVPADERISLSESGKGVFDSGPLTVDYSYTLRGGNLDLTGAAWHSGGYDSLNVYLLFIDASGTVLQRNIVYYSGYRVGHWPGAGDRSFQSDLDVPASAAGFSFDYSAQPKTIRR